MPAQDNSSVRARQGARDLLIKALYQWQLGGHDREELLEQFALEPEYAQIDKRYFRPTEVDCLQGDSSKAREKLKWKPKVQFDQLVRMMVDADMKLVEKEL